MFPSHWICWGPRMLHTFKYLNRERESDSQPLGVLLVYTIRDFILVSIVSLRIQLKLFPQIMNAEFPPQHC